MMGKTTSSRYCDSGYAWLVWGLAAAFFFCDYFARVSPSVMVHELMRSFQVTAAGLGGLSSFFYYPYLAMQIPVGLLVDRFSVRGLLTVMTCLTGVACALFGSAHVVSMAQLARFTLGFGAAFAFVSALKLASQWFSPSRFGLLAGLTQALGMLGAVVGEAPVAYAVSAWGWRQTMWVMAVIFAILALCILVFVRDRPNDHKNHLSDTQKDTVSIFKSLSWVLSNPQTWWNALYAGLVFAPTAAFAELWGVAYLEHVHHLPHHTAALANGLIFLGWGIGGPIVGWISDRLQRRKPLMFVSAIGSGLTMSMLFFLPNLSQCAIFSLLFCYGLANTGVAIAYAVSAEINPPYVGGTSMAFANMMSVVPGALLQVVIGLLLDWHASGHLVAGVPVYTAADFHAVMMLLPLTLLLAVFVAIFIRETYCRVDNAQHVES